MKNIEKIITFLEKELKWNGSRIILNPATDPNDKFKTLIYECYAGSSVIKEIKEALKSIGVTATVNWLTPKEDRTEAAGLSDHEYLITIKSISPQTELILDSILKK